MKASRAQGAVSLPIVNLMILAGALLLSLLFYSFWQKLNQKVEVILRDQFNRQQLELARKIADNVESYFDFLENALLGYAGLFQTTPPDARGPLVTALAERFERHQHFGVLALRRYDAAGVLEQSFSATPGPTATPSPKIVLHPAMLQWAKDSASRGRLYLSKTYTSVEPPWEGRKVMRFLTPLYWGAGKESFAGVLELVIDPFFISQKVTAGVRSGESGYAWVIDQDGVFLAHYEKDFVGHDAIQVRLARNPNITFKGLRELQARLLQGQEGIGGYSSGWHRQRLGEMPKLAAYTPIRFDKGLIRGVTTVEEPVRNLWGVALVAPVEEVSGQIEEVLHQELFLVGLFFLVVLIAGGGLFGAAFTWNKTLAREVELKTRELLDSQERLVRSERFAAVGEAASYVSHEIKNPLMVIGGLAQQIERRLAVDPNLQEKLRIIQSEVRRLENFLGELRDFTRPALPVKQEIDLNQVIREVQTLMEGAAREKGITLLGNLDRSLPRVEADPNQMKQVLLNLLKNALEALDHGGRITLASGLEDGQAWFSVADNGIGMSPEVLERVFNPFFTTKDKGTGLGLAVIHKIMTDHHGTIEIESVPGQGSKFTVKFPLRG